MTVAGPKDKGDRREDTSGAAFEKDIDELFKPREEKDEETEQD